MSKFSKWAGRKTPLIETPPAPSVPVPQPTIQAGYTPMSHGQPLIHYAPMSRPPVTLYPSQVFFSDVPQTDLLMEPDMNGSSYERLLTVLPERAPMSEIDATKLPGMPDGQTTDKWTDQTRYRNGSSDASGLPKFLEFVRGKYRTAGGAIRSAAGMRVGPAIR